MKEVVKNFQKVLEATRNNKEALVTEGFVVAVDKDARTCDIRRDNLPTLYDVRINATLEPGDDVISVFPKKESKVIVVTIGNNSTDAYLLSATDIEEVIIKIGNSEFSVNNDGWIIKNQESLKEILTSIVSAMKNITVTTYSGLSGTPVNAATEMEPIKNKINKLLRE